jgi:hypothetical protein
MIHAVIDLVLFIAILVFAAAYLFATQAPGVLG